MAKKKIKYTEMCMYVDKHILDPDADVVRIYKYLVNISRMLAMKRNFFNNRHYYEEFANYFATIIYNRMTDKRQFLPKDDPNWLSPIKSCLNYMKGIIYARKCAFCYEEFNFTTDLNKEDIVDAFRNTVRGNAVDYSKDTLQVEVVEYFSRVEGIVKDIVYKGIYGKDKLLAFKIYTALMISLLRNFTLSNKNKNRLIDYRKMHRVGNNDRVYYKCNAEDIITECMVEETDLAPIAYDLEDKYKDYIAFLLQKVKSTIIKDIKFLASNYQVSDDLIEDVLLSNAYGEKEN